jgi:geranylgeranyl diphosphate synthase type I
VSAHATDFDPLDDDSSDADLAAVVSIAAGLETFHAAALVHDDIMDNSDLRRGQPSVHRAFAQLHAERGWEGSPDGYGLSAALLLGDLLLGWSDDLVDAGVALSGDAASGRAAREEFARMRTEVTAGQYLDIFEEMAWRALPESEHLSRAQRVIVFKSAKYSVEAPLAIGASLAGGSLAQIAALRDFGLPLGIAFQLRDDLLGVFGDPSVTGKPAGDDLREGKRTVLVTLVRQKLPPSAARVFDELLGDRSLDADQIAMLQTAVRDSGAVDHVERAITHHLSQARSALATAPIARSARDELTALAEAATTRTF